MNPPFVKATIHLFLGGGVRGVFYFISFFFSSPHSVIITPLTPLSREVDVSNCSKDKSLNTVFSFLILKTRHRCSVYTISTSSHPFSKLTRAQLLLEV